MRLRLPLLSGALAAVAIVASPGHAAVAAGCSSTKPAGRRQVQAQLQASGRGARQGQALRDRDDHIMRRDPDRPRSQARRADPELGRVPRRQAFLRRADVPPRRSPDICSRAAIRRRRDGRARLRGRRRAAALVPLQGRRHRDGQDRERAARAPPARSSSSSRAATARGCRPSTACSAMPPTWPRSRRSSGSPRSPPPRAAPGGCPPSKKVWIVTHAPRRPAVGR